MLIARRYRGPAATTAHSIAASLEGGWRSLSNPHWRLLGAAGFLWLDVAALWAACAATGHPAGMLALALAYFGAVFLMSRSGTFNHPFEHPP